MASERVSGIASGHSHGYDSLSAERSYEKRDDQHHSGTQTMADAYDRAGSHGRSRFPTEAGKTSMPKSTNTMLPNR